MVLDKTIIKKEYEMQKENDIKEKIKGCEERERYLQDFLSTIYKKSKPKEQVDKELIALKRERNALEWVLESNNLPF